MIIAIRKRAKTDIERVETERGKGCNLLPTDSGCFKSLLDISFPTEKNCISINQPVGYIQMNQVYHYYVGNNLAILTDQIS